MSKIQHQWIMGKKKIYFAGSIRGGRVDAALYHRIITHMQRTHVVLTEHVGKSDLSLQEQGRERDARIYNQDTAWLRESDLLTGNPYFHIHPYSREEDIYPLLDQILASPSR